MKNSTLILTATLTSTRIFFWKKVNTYRIQKRHLLTALWGRNLTLVHGSCNQDTIKFLEHIKWAWNNKWALHWFIRPAIIAWRIFYQMEPKMYYCFPCVEKHLQGFQKPVQCPWQPIIFLPPPSSMFSLWFSLNVTCMKRQFSV